MRIHPSFATILVSALLLGCPDGQTNAGDAGSTSSTGESSSTGPQETTESTIDTDEPTSAASEVDEPTTADTGGIGDGMCDPWAQDCPDGHKCMAFAGEDENVFSGTKCTPVVADPGVEGDPCTVEGGWWSGIDDCDHGLACWNIDHETNTGDCVSLCTGNQDSFECPTAGDVCVFWVPGLAHVCLQACDPLLQDCPTGQACLPEWASGGEQFTCKPEYSGEEGQIFDACEYSNTCDPGLICLLSEEAVECDQDAGGCCLPFCDLGSPECSGQGAVCSSLYEMLGTEAPPNFADVGLCVLPG